jgi:hypothetical protein
MARPSIDRINTNGHYTFLNCRFIELAYNKSRPRMKSKNKTSRYKGVFFDKERNKFGISFRENGKSRHITTFKSEIEAARTYDRIATDLYGEDAILNFEERF